VGVRLIVEFAAKHNIAVLAGALTPTEVVTAWSGGATPLFGAAITNFVSTSFAQGRVCHTPDW
jgi:2-keto-3-deoxy-6-phosphogluconate aldolase